MKPTTSQTTAKPAERKERGPGARGRLVLEDGEMVSRVFMVTLGSFLLRLEREKRGLYGSDLDLSSVFDVVAIGAIEPALRNAGFRAAFSSFNAVVGVEGQRGINAMSIAAATGIPRETVRRKLKRLVDQGLIIEKSKGHYVVAPGRLQSGDYQAAFGRGIRETVRFMNECVENGLVQWVPNPAKDKGDDRG